MEQRNHLGVFHGLVALTVTAVLLSICTSTAEGKLFAVNDPETSVPCALVDVDFTLYLTAEQDDLPVADAELTSEDDGVTVTGSCGLVASVVNLFFPQGANWALKFTQDDAGEVRLTKLIQFVPNKVFAERVPSTDYQLMDDPGVTDLYNSEYSYECPDLDVAEYEPVTVTTTDYNYTVTANISYIKAQAFNVKDGNFSDSIICGTVPTSTASPNVTTTHVQTTTAHVSTTTPTPPRNLYVVKENNVTCIAMEATLTLDIEYNLKGKKDKKETAKFVIPDNAKASGSCSLSPTAQLLTISFFKNWELSFVFSSAKKENLLSALNTDKPKHPSYHISKVAVTFYPSEERFPGSDFTPGAEQHVVNGALNSAKVSDKKGYYKCDKTLDTKVTSEVTVQSEKLEVKAFNGDNSADFSGSVAECAADSGSSKRTTYIIVGCVLGGLVLLCLIVFVVMRVIRRRRENYHSLQ